jgi:hypothetical protein
MARVIDREFTKVEKVVEKYCLKDKEDKVIECVEGARCYAYDFPEKADIDEAIRLVKKAGRYISGDGKAEYEQVSAGVIKQLNNVPLEPD